MLDLNSKTFYNLYTFLNIMFIEYFKFKILFYYSQKKKKK